MPAITQVYGIYLNEITRCMGSRHIGHRLPSLGLFGKPIGVELVGCEVTEGLVRSAGFIAVVPGEECAVKAAQVSGEFVEVVELIIVGAEEAFDWPDSRQSRARKPSAE